MDVNRVADAWLTRHERRNQKRCYAPRPPPRLPSTFFGPSRVRDPRHARIVNLVRQTQWQTGLGGGTSYRARAFWGRTPVVLGQMGRRAAQFYARVEAWMALLREYGAHKKWDYFEFGGAREVVERNIELIAYELRTPS